MCVLVWLYHPLLGVIMRFPPWWEHPPPNLSKLHGKVYTFAHTTSVLFAEALLGLVTTSLQVEVTLARHVSSFRDQFLLGACFHCEWQKHKGENGNTNTSSSLRLELTHCHSAYIPLTKTNHMAKPNLRGPGNRLHTVSHSKDEKGRENCGPKISPIALDKQNS